MKGHNSEAIVSSDSDRRSLMSAIAAALSAAGVEVWSWALLTNHLHLFLRGSIADISLAMRKSLAPYAQRRNVLMDRSGSVFKDRFWSRPVADEGYALALLVYVLLNPLKAGIVRTVDELVGHPWCALGALVLDTPTIVPVNAGAGLELFGRDVVLARNSLLGCLEVQAEEWRMDTRMETMAAIVRVIAARHGLPVETLTDGTRGRWFWDAKRDVILEGRRRGYSDDAIADALHMSRSAVWKLAGPRAA